MGTHKEIIKAFIVENFLFGSADGLTLETSFLDEGIIDSTGILELVDFLEKEFNIAIEDDELVPENLDTIKNVDAYISRKVASPASAAELTFSRNFF
jgi:acyl carrier protein